MSILLIYNIVMSVSSEALAGQERVELASVRLRQPERHQMAMVVSCPDDLVSATHPVRLLQAVVERLDLKQFYEPIQARQGVAGRDATDPRLLVALWLYACTCGIGSARELARRCAGGKARWSGQAGRKGPPASATRKHHRCPGPGDEDAQRRFQSCGQRAVGHRHREPRDPRRSGDERGLR